VVLALLHAKVAYGAVNGLDPLSKDDLTFLARYLGPMRDYQKVDTLLDEADSVQLPNAVHSRISLSESRIPQAETQKGQVLKYQKEDAQR
jgi:hypothetical protein